MHTLVIEAPEGEVRVHYNSDWSGKALVTWEGASVELPAWVVRRLLPSPAADQAISIMEALSTALDTNSGRGGYVDDDMKYVSSGVDMAVEAIKLVVNDGVDIGAAVARVIAKGPR